MKNKLFISWSKASTRGIADSLARHLELMLPRQEVFVSTRDITLGENFRNVIDEQLKSSSFALICVNSENIKEPWLHYEAGAISATIEKAHIIPLLFDGDFEIIKDTPLGVFHAIKYDKEAIRQIVDLVSDDKTRAQEYFKKFWPDLEADIAQHMGREPAHKPKGQTSKNTSRRPPFRFSMIGLKAGDELSFVDDGRIKCKVATDRTVTFRKNEMSLTRAAGIVLEEWGEHSDVAGPRYWCWQGQTLAELRSPI